MESIAVGFSQRFKESLPELDFSPYYGYEKLIGLKPVEEY
jgi:hypothetical protein